MQILDTDVTHRNVWQPGFRTLLKLPLVGRRNSRSVPKTLTSGRESPRTWEYIEHPINNTRLSGKLHLNISQRYMYTHTHVYILIHRYIAQYIYIYNTQIFTISSYNQLIMYMQFWHILKSHEEAARDDRMPQLLGVFPMGITHQQKCSETDEWWRFSIGTDKDKT